MPRWQPRPPVGDPNDPRGFEALLSRYVEWLGVHHYSPHTEEAARRLLRLFAEWCAEREIVRPAEVDRTTIERYQRWLYHHRREDGRPLGFKTQQQRLSMVKSFFRWLVQERYLLHNPASELVLPRKPPRLPVDGFSIEEAERVLAVPDVETPLGLRDRALLEVLYATGMRRSELVGLDLYDLDLSRAWATIRHGKGDKDRVVPLGERALAWVSRYLEEVRPSLVATPAEWAVFVSAEGERWSPAGLTNHVRRLIEAAGVRPRRGACHLFRHTCATLMLEGGADLRFIQELLGHASPETTQVYTRVSIDKLAQIHAATHPAARLRRREAGVDTEQCGGGAAGELGLAGDVDDGGDVER
jgi:integrase/recombinase XerD